MFSRCRYTMTVCYLDDDPATVGARLAPVLERAWENAPVRPLLAAPFESMMRWDWDRFGPNRRLTAPPPGVATARRRAVPWVGQKR